MLDNVRRETSDLGWRLYVLVAAAVIAVGVVNALSAAHDHARNGGAYDLGLPLFAELTSVVIIAALAPAVAAGVRRMRMAWLLRRWWALIGLAVVIVVGFSFVHIVGMVWLRKIAAVLYGSGYQFSWTASELAYEFRKDLATCALFGITFWLALSRNETATASRVAPDAVDASSTARDHIWLRDGATSVRVNPGEVVWVASAGNYVEYRMADGATHLIRGTLAAEEARLRPFGLVRVHRTRMVNLGRVVGVAPRASGDFELRLDVGESISGSRRYRDAIAGLACNPVTQTVGIEPLTKSRNSP